MEVIRQSIAIADTAENIYVALTSKEDLQEWWRAINPEADGETIWYGLDRQYAVPIVANDPGTSIAFAFDAHHPYDADRTEPTTITITITEGSELSTVTVLQSAFSEEDWNTLIHDGWVYSLLSLWLWVERGVRLSDWLDANTYHTVERIIPLSRSAENVFAQLTDRSVWPILNVQHEPRMLLETAPRNLILAWEDRVQLWTVVPARAGCVVKINEFGHNRTRLNNTAIRYLERDWTAREAAIREFFGTENG